MTQNANEAVTNRGQDDIGMQIFLSIFDEGKLLLEHRQCRPVPCQSLTDKLTLFKLRGQI